MIRSLLRLVFQPTGFTRSLEALPSAALYRFAAVALLWPIALAIVVAALAGLGYESIGIAFNWWRASAGLALGIAGSIAFGLALAALGSPHTGVALALVMSAVLGAGAGVAGGVAGGVASRLATAAGLESGLAHAVTSAIGTAIGFGLIVGVALTRITRVAGGLAVAITIGLAMSASTWVMFGPRVGLISAITAPIVFALVYFRIVTYPAHVALAAATYFVARRRPERVMAAWRVCPVAWNEMIWLPLPFVGKLLELLAQRDRGEGMRQITFVAAERPMQRRAALGALVQVAASDLEVETLSAMSRVATRFEGPGDVTAALPASFAAAMPRFERVAEHVGQYEGLQSAYRKAEALTRALAELETLQRTLVSAGDRVATRLLAAANRWRRLLEDEQATLSARADLAREIVNPFVFGNPVAETEHNVFSGRRDIVRLVEDTLLGAAQAPTLLLHGARRMGKSSVLNQLPRLIGPDFAPALVDCQNPAVTEGLGSLVQHLSRAVRNGLARRRVNVEPIAATALASGPFAALEDWLDAVERAMPSAMRVLLCLDEYEHLNVAVTAGWGTGFLDALRHLVQHRPRLAALFCGSHTFAELGPVWSDRFISARRVKVSFLDRAEVELLLTHPVPTFDLTYVDGSVDAVYGATRGQPFLTQAVAFELVQYVNETRRRAAAPADVAVAIARALDSAGEFFANVWHEAADEERRLLVELARTQRPLSDARAASRLRERDVVTEAGTFAVPLVERWILERQARSG